MADEVPFDIPDSWEWVRFGSIVANYDSKRRPVTKEQRKNEHGYYDYYGATGAIDRVDDYIFEGEYLMIGEDGGNFFTERDNAFIASGRFWANNHVHIVQPIVCDIHFLKHFLDSCNLPKMGLINGIAVPKLNQEHLNSILVPLPPLSEQAAIVAELSKYAPLLDEYQLAYSEIKLLNDSFPERLKKSILQEAVQGKLVPQDPSDEPAEALLERIRVEKQRLIKEGKIKKDKHESVIFRRDNSHYEKLDGVERCIDDELPFEIPESWAWVRWGSIAESIQYGYNAPAKQEGRIRMVRISDIHENTVAWSSVPFCDIEDSDIPTYLLQPNDILFARTGGTVGKSFLVSEVPCESIYAGYLIRTRYSSLLCPQYLKFFMESPLYWQQLESGTTATAQPNCNGQTLAKMLLPLPPANEQLRIVENLVRTFAIIDKM